MKAFYRILEDEKLGRILGVVNLNSSFPSLKWTWYIDNELTTIETYPIPEDTEDEITLDIMIQILWQLTDEDIIGNINEVNELKTEEPQTALEDIESMLDKKEMH